MKKKGGLPIVLDAKDNQKRRHAELDSASHLIFNSESGEILKRVQDDRIFNGFTLIELLVVVLIIGILAAVALPQYQKAVKRSRFATLKNITRALANAEELYYLANGEYTVDVEELDVALPGTIKAISKHADTNWQYNLENITCTLINNGYGGISAARVQCQQNYNLLYGVFLQHAAEQYAGKQRCGIISTNAASITIDHQICKQESGGAEVAANGTDYFY